MPEFPNDTHDASPTEPQHGPGWLHDDHDTAVHDNHATSSSDTPDWLKEAGSPFGEEDVLAKETSLPDKTSQPAVTTASDTSTKPASDIPDWLHDSHDEKTPAPQETHTIEKPTADSAKQNDIPDWLHEESTTPVTPENNVPATTSKPTEVKEVTAPKPSTTTEDLPDWLSGTHEEETTMPEPVATIAKTPDTTQPTENEIFAPSTESTGLASTTATPVSLDHDDIPDWLRGAEEVTESTVEA